MQTTTCTIYIQYTVFGLLVYGIHRKRIAAHNGNQHKRTTAHDGEAKTLRSGEVRSDKAPLV